MVASGPRYAEQVCREPNQGPQRTEVNEDVRIQFDNEIRSGHITVAA